MVKLLYHHLGLKTEDVDQAGIRKAYFQQARKYHPDKNPEGAEQFKAIAQAYAILSDETKRAKYDAGLMDENENKIEPRAVSQSAIPVAEMHPKTAPIHVPRRPSATPDEFKPAPASPARASSRVHSFPTSPFFEPETPSTYHYFFNHRRDVFDFNHSRRREAPVFVYLTEFPLRELTCLIAMGLMHSGLDKRKAATHYKAANDTHPEHIFVCAAFSLDCVFSYLLTQGVLIGAVSADDAPCFRR